MKFVFVFEDEFEDGVSFDKEDGGRALIAHFEQKDCEEEEAGLFVRLQSYDETKIHKDAQALVGKRVRITVEVI